MAGNWSAIRESHFPILPPGSAFFSSTVCWPKSLLDAQQTQLENVRICSLAKSLPYTTYFVQSGGATSHNHIQHGRVLCFTGITI